MKISLTDAGKRFNRDWIFRHFTYSFESGQSYAIIGPNGSGKSTLLQALSGNMLLSEGQIKFEGGSAKDEGPNFSYDNDEVYQRISICAPYLELVEEMTLVEFFNFHTGFKPFFENISIQEIITRLGLETAINKQIRYFSSGMKQRVKLAQAIFSGVDTILLDEPCTNLDTAGIELYLSLIQDYCLHRLVIVSSNDETEFSFCSHHINMTDIKG
jgi:ABC-type multidrug transport system ATPase subunit